MPHPTFAEPKDPDAVLDYAFDWKPATNGSCDDPDCEDWLQAGETISTYTVTSHADITVDGDTESGGKVTVTLSGGTAGNTYWVRCHITTNAGRQDDRTMYVHVEDR